MYYIPLAVLLCFGIAEQKIRDKYHVMYKLAIIMLTIMACLRYGQGSDYFGYMTNYYLEDTHSEIGFQMLCQLLRKFGILFEGFIFGISLFQMICLSRAIRIFSPYRTLSLLLLYPALFSYVMSGISQGVIVAFFLGFMLKWLLDKKWLWYIIVCLLLSTIYSAAFITLAAFRVG